MKTDNTLLYYMDDVIKCYQEFMVNIRYKGNKQDDLVWKRNNKIGAYGFVPTKGITELVKILMSVFSYSTKKLKRENISFLDAGCGAGNILLIARVVGFNDVYGIELDVNTIKIAKKLLKHATLPYRKHPGNFHIIKANLLEYDKYKKYDVIYYYQPMRPGDMYMTKFLSLVKENMKIGAIVIVNGADPFYKDKKFRIIRKLGKLHDIDGVYEKIAN